jgi:SpoVK/Ycf46/Vps4 family AAA+-type ATPase
VSKVDPVHDLVLLVRSGHQLLHLDTVEEERVSGLLLHVADRLDKPLFTWGRVQGLSRVDLPGAVYDTEHPAKAFQHVAASDQPGLYHFKDLLPHLEQDAVLAAQMKEAATKLRGTGGAILVTGRGIPFPASVERMVTVFTMPSPTPEEYKDLLSQIVRDVSQRQHVEMALIPEEITLLVRHLTGLTLMESEKILTKAIIEDGKLTVEDIRHVIEAKVAVVERDGLLEYYPVEAALSNIADLRSLKDWLAKRKAVVTQPDRAQEFGLSFPRGLLLLGVPGCGKSLAAKAVVAEWRMPLLKLDPSNLDNKYIGDSERNFKRAMRTAELIAPVVLWIDELEKAFASGGGEDGGVSQRILGSFLTWMQDGTGDVFVVATANDISRLPAEFLRKGRFDEIFFVDLPDLATRAEIFRIHLQNRGKDSSLFDLETLGAATGGFSGSEIEVVVVSSLYSAFSETGALTTESLLKEAAGTVPLSVSRAEHIDELRAWARERARPAN